MLDDFQILEYYNHKYWHKIEATMLLTARRFLQNKKTNDLLEVLTRAMWRDVVLKSDNQEELGFPYIEFVWKEDPKREWIEQLISEAEEFFAKKMK